MASDPSGDHGDESDAAALAAHYLAFKRVALRLIRDAHDAEDLTQQTFLRVTEKCEQLQSRSSLKSWGFQILHNECCTLIRDRSRHRQSKWRPHDLDQLPVADELPLTSESEQTFAPLCIEFISQLAHQLPGTPALVVRVWISERGDNRETAKHLLHDQEGIDSPSEDVIRKKVAYIRMNRTRFCSRLRNAVQDALPEEPTRRGLMMMMSSFTEESESL